MSGNFAEIATSTPFRDLLHAANLRHGTDGFTSPHSLFLLRKERPIINIRLHGEMQGFKRIQRMSYGVL
jgi:hypothetical protein